LIGSASSSGASRLPGAEDVQMEAEDGVYYLSDEEWADVQEGIAQADPREFVPDEVVAEADKRLGM
jgi:hypothetical protein